MSRNFTKHFLKSLETPITIEADDPPEVVELKSAVIGAKEELKTLYGEGKNLRDVMMQCREDLRQLGLYRKELEKELDRIAKDRTLTESVMGQFVHGTGRRMWRGRLRLVGRPARKRKV